MKSLIINPKLKISLDILASSLSLLSNISSIIIFFIAGWGTLNYTSPPTIIAQIFFTLISVLIAILIFITKKLSSLLKSILLIIFAIIVGALLLFASFRTTEPKTEVPTEVNLNPPKNGQFKDSVSISGYQMLPEKDGSIVKNELCITLPAFIIIKPPYSDSCKVSIDKNIKKDTGSSIIITFNYSVNLTEHNETNKVYKKNGFLCFIKDIFQSNFLKHLKRGYQLIKNLIKNRLFYRTEQKHMNKITEINNFIKIEVRKKAKENVKKKIRQTLGQPATSLPPPIIPIDTPTTKYIPEPSESTTIHIPPPQSVTTRIINLNSINFFRNLNHKKWYYCGSEIHEIDTLLYIEFINENTLRTNIFNKNWRKNSKVYYHNYTITSLKRDKNDAIEASVPNENIDFSFVGVEENKKINLTILVKRKDYQLTAVKPFKEIIKKDTIQYNDPIIVDKQ